MPKIYFASDMHLGFPRQEESIHRERKVVQWLDEIIDQADELYLLGDVFDFWFEYKHVVPRGFTRFLGKLAEFTDRGKPVHFFTGNHDVWVFDYLPKEIGVQVHRKPIIEEIDGRTFFIGHGDGLGSGDVGYKLLKGIFTNKVLQWLFARLHPNGAVGFAHRWSKHSRYSKGFAAEDYNPEKEHLVSFIKTHEAKAHCDYYIFGHRHFPVHHKVGEATYVNLGDWLNHFSYAYWDGEQMHLEKYQED
mgnify:CR=1 FL=1